MTEPRFFLGGDGGGGGRLFQILSLRMGANSKWGAYLELDANEHLQYVDSTSLFFASSQFLKTNVWDRA